MVGIFGGIRERIWGNLSWEGRKAGDLLYKEGKSLYNDHICIFGCLCFRFFWKKGTILFKREGISYGIYTRRSF